MATGIGPGSSPGESEPTLARIETRLARRAHRDALTGTASAPAGPSENGAMKSASSILLALLGTVTLSVPAEAATWVIVPSESDSHAHVTAPTACGFASDISIAPNSTTSSDPIAELFARTALSFNEPAPGPAAWLDVPAIDLGVSLIGPPEPGATRPALGAVMSFGAL